MDALRAFADDPVNLLRIFAVADKHNLDFHPDVLKLLTRSLRYIDPAVRANDTEPPKTDVEL